MLRGQRRPVAVAPAVATTSAAPVPAVTAAPKVMPNLTGLPDGQAISVLTGVYPASHPQMDPITAPGDATVASQEPAGGTALEPADGTVILHMTGGTPTPTGESTTDSSSSDSGGSVDLANVHHHDHVPVCVGGKHVHVCS